PPESAEGRLDLAELAEIGAGADAACSPGLRARDHAIAQLVVDEAGLLDLDHRLADRGLDRAAELVALLGHDGERLHDSAQQPREVVDLGLGRVAPGVEPEVHAHRAGHVAASRRPESDRRLTQPSLGSHRNFNEATTNPVAPHAASTPSAAGFVHTAWLRR